MSNGNAKSSNIIAEFICLECEEIYDISQQFEGRPVCVTCAGVDNISGVLKKERKDVAATNILEISENTSDMPVVVSKGYQAKETVDVIESNDEFFCVECEKNCPLDMQFEDKPLCISCVNSSRMDGFLQDEAVETQREVAETQKKPSPSRTNNVQQLNISERLRNENNMKQNEQVNTNMELNVTEADWVNVIAGDFLMGSSPDEAGRDSDESLHRINVAEVKMMVKPVTFEQYDLFCSETGKEKPSDKGWGRDNRPVINVSYWDAVDYAEWLTEKTGWSCRLPTEAEWEYACRANGDAAFNVGSTISCAQSNYDGLYIYGQGNRGISRWKTFPTASFSANAWGLYDMHGNVWEWCASEYDSEYSGLEMMDACFDRMNNVPRSLRGGSWHSRPVFLRSACRYRFNPDESSQEWGFRLVRTT